MEWKEAFAPHILKRGYNYADEDRVSIQAQNDAQITASVTGTREYEVRIELDSDTVTDMSCTCPYAEDGNACKHMAAVLYAAKLFKQPTYRQTDQISLRDAIDRLPREFMKELLLQHAGTSQMLRREIVMHATGKIPNEQKELWYRTIRRIIKKYADSYGYADDENAFYLIEELTDYMDKEIEQLWQYGMYEAAFDLVCMVFQTVSLIEHSEDSFTELFLVCDEWWENLLAKADYTLRQTMRAWFITTVKTNRGYARQWLEKTSRRFFGEA